MTQSALLEQAKALIENREGRATRSRIQVLAFLLSQHDAMTHYQIEQKFGEHDKMDRVTLYRVLEWLTDQGLAHKLLSSDRAWRFLANNNHAHSHQHAHFTCNQCAKVICLDTMPASYVVALPEGYRMQGIDLTVKGLCVSCV